MGKVENTRESTASGSTTSEQTLQLPKSVPDISDDELDGALRRSPRARRLHAELQRREREGRPLSAAEVEKVVKGSTKANGKPDGEQAVVLASHARKCPGVFGGAHRLLLRLLSRVLWGSLLNDLRELVAKVREQEAEEKKRETIKRDLEEDRLEQDTRRVDLVREPQKREITAPVKIDEQLSADNKLRLTLERMKRP